MKLRNDLTIGIVSAGRTVALRRNLERIHQVFDFVPLIIVFDNTPSKDRQRLVEKNSVSKYLDEVVQCSPAESRQRIIEATETKYLCLLDDDIIPIDNAVQSLIDHLETHNADIASGIMMEENGARSAGCLFNVDGGVIEKWCIDRRTMESGFEEVDMGTPPMVADTKIFGEVSFDGRYDFFYEWFDFFMQCRREGVKVHVLKDAEFRHISVNYNEKTIKVEQDPDRDQIVFSKKWGLDIRVPDVKDRYDWKKLKENKDMVSAGTHEVATIFLKGMDNDDKVVNLGCNHGTPSNWFSEGMDITNVDVQEKDRENFVQSDLNKDFPFKDDSFDIVLGIEIIEYLENPWHFIRECRRVMRDDGRIIISIPNIVSPRSRKLFLDKGVFRWFTFEKGLNEGDHINPIPPWELNFICLRNGLRFEKIGYNNKYREIVVFSVVQDDNPFGKTYEVLDPETGEFEYSVLEDPR